MELKVANEFSDLNDSELDTVNGGTLGGFLLLGIFVVGYYWGYKVAKRKG